MAKRTRRIAIGVGVALGISAFAAWATVSSLDRRADAAPLKERLQQIPIPGEFVLVDEWAFDGQWLFGRREAEAIRVYLAAGSVDETCSMVDRFYAADDPSPIRRSDDPKHWCGRSIRLRDGRVRIYVDRLDPWRDIPTVLEDSPAGPDGEPAVVEIEYRAHHD